MKNLSILLIHLALSAVFFTATLAQGVVTITVYKTITQVVTVNVPVPKPSPANPLPSPLLPDKPLNEVPSALTLIPVQSEQTPAQIFTVPVVSPQTQQPYETPAVTYVYKTVEQTFTQAQPSPTESQTVAPYSSYTAQTFTPLYTSATPLTFVSYTMPTASAFSTSRNGNVSSTVSTSFSSRKPSTTGSSTSKVATDTATPTESAGTVNNSGVLLAVGAVLLGLFVRF